MAWPWRSPSALSPPYPRQPTLPGKQLDEKFYNMQRDLWTEFQSRPSSEESWARTVQVMVRLELDFQFCTIIYKLCGLQNELFCISFESQKQEGSVKHCCYFCHLKNLECVCSLPYQIITYALLAAGTITDLLINWILPATKQMMPLVVSISISSF